jgi:ADP-ribosylglycohydrolase
MAVMLSVDHQRGTLIGPAAGDALGTAVEFEMPSSFQELTGYHQRLTSEGRTP